MEISSSLKITDMQAHKQSLEEAMQTILQSLPAQKPDGSSSRDNINYRKVSAHLASFKEKCLNPLKEFETKKASREILQYIGVALVSNYH